jgi:diamine N-acetyltransferase
MILRPASVEDVPALADLGRQSFTDAFGHLYAPADLEAFLSEWRSPEKFAAAVENPDTAVMLAEDAEAPFGYCVVYFNQSFAERPEPKPERPCLLGQLYCAKAATGRGVGAALIEWAIAEARNRACDAVQLSVYCENFGAQRFYARYGFEKVGDIDFWVGDHRDDEFLYELRL